MCESQTQQRYQNPSTRMKLVKPKQSIRPPIHQARQNRAYASDGTARADMCLPTGVPEAEDREHLSPRMFPKRSMRNPTADPNDGSHLPRCVNCLTPRNCAAAE